MRLMEYIGILSVGTAGPAEKMCSSASPGNAHLPGGSYLLLVGGSDFGLQALEL